MRKNTFINYLTKGLLTLAALCLFTNCEVGLGESVDTQPPEVTISYPPTDSIIRDWFKMNGSANDETSLSKVTVSFKGLNNEGQRGPFEASVNTADSSWTLELNRTLGQIPDGSYEVTVTAIDNAQRSTVAKTTYKIDNTAPVLAVSTPATKGSTTPYDFGNYLNFSGLQYDVNTGGQFLVTFYKKAADGSIVLISKATPSNSLDSWSFSIPENDPSFEALKNAMDDKNSPQQFWYTISVSDSAQVFQTPDNTSSPTDSAGNYSQYYFSWDDIVDTVATGEKLPLISSIYNVFYNLKSEVGNVPAKLNKSYLDSKQIDANAGKDTSGTFSIDPNNISPIISIDGMMYGPNKASTNQIALESILRIEVGKGKDLDATIKSNEMSVTIEKMTGSDSDGNPTYIDLDDWKDRPITADEYTGTSPVVINLSLTGIQTGEYRATFNARNTTTSIDSKGTPAIHNVWYFIVNAGAPTLSVRPGTNDTQKVQPDENGNFAVTVTGTDDGTSLFLTIEEEKNSKWEKIYDSISNWTSSGLDNGRNKYQMDLTLPITNELGSSRKLKFTLTDGKYSTVSTRTFIVDNSAPTLKLLEKPLMTAGSIQVSSPIVSVKGYSDEDLAYAWVYVTNDNIAPAANKPHTTLNVDGEADDRTISGKSIKVKGFDGTVSVSENIEGNYYLWLRFADDTYDPNNNLDSNGNPIPSGVVISLGCVKFDVAEPNATMTVGEAENYSYQEGTTYYRGGEFILSGICNDSASTSNRKAETVKLTRTDSNDITEVLTLTTGGKDSGTWTYTQPVNSTSHENDGFFTYTLEVTDISGKKKTVSTKVCIDTTPPVVEITSPTTTEYVQNKNLIVRGIANDGESGTGLQEITLKYNGNEAVTVTPADNWTQVINIPDTDADGSKTLEITVKDKSNNQQTINSTFMLDVTAPTATIDDITPNDGKISKEITGETFPTVNGAFTISGEANDSAYFNTATLSCSKDGAIATTIPAGTRENQFNRDTVTGTWSYIQPDVDGLYAYTLTVTDMAGHKTTATKTVRIDKTPPEITIVAPSLTGDSINTTKYTTNGTIKDAGSGVAELTYRYGTTDTVDSAEANTITINGTSWTQEVSLQEGQEGSYVIRYDSKDKYGNIMASEKRDLYVDFANPTLVEKGVGSSSKTTNKTFELKGYVYDSNELNAEKALQIVGQGANVILNTSDMVQLTAVNKVEYGISTDTDVSNGKYYGWTKEVIVGAGGITTDGEYTYTITATDVASKPTILTRTVIIDKTPPTVVISSTPNSQTVATSNSYTFDGTADDGTSLTSTGVASVYTKYQSSGSAPTNGNKTGASTATGTSSWMSVVNDLVEGAGTLYVCAEDKAGNISDWTSANFIFDMNKPVLTVQKISGYQKENFIIEGTLSDSWKIKDTNPIEISLDGKKWTPTIDSANAKWSQTITVDTVTDGTTNTADIKEDGSYNFSIKGYDAAGKVVETTSSISVDTKVPEVTVSSPTAEQYVQASGAAATLSFIGTASDIGSGVKSIELTYDGIIYTVPVASNWSYALSGVGAEGPKEVKVKVTDNADSVTEKTFKIYIDLHAPAAVINEPTVLNSSTLVKEGSGSSEIFAFNGDYTLSANTTDKYLDLDNISLKYSKDNGPEITITPVTVSDSSGSSGTLSYTPTIDKVTHADDGLYTYTLTVKDKANREVTVKKTIRVDTTAPSLATNLENDLNITDKTTKTVTISYSDSGVGMSTAVDAVTYQINTGDVENVTGTSATLTFEQGNNQSVTITAKDKLGNVAKLIKTGINVDTEAPTLTAITPVPTYIKKDGAFTFGGNATDNIDLNCIEIVATRNGTRVDQTGNTTSGFWYSKTFTNTTSADSATLAIPVFTTSGKEPDKVNGTWTFVITVYDKAKNSNSVTKSFIVDVLAPTVDEVSNYPIARIDSSTPFTFRGKASDTGASGVQKVEYSLNGTDWETVDGNTTWYKDVELTEGTGTFYARATDNAGNVSAVKTQEYVFDKAAPTMTVTDGLTQSSSKLFTMKGTASDSWKVNKVEITQIKGETELTVPIETITPNSFINWSTEASVLPLKAENTTYTATEIANHEADGVYTYKVTVTDAAGKTVDSTVTITFDTTAPTVTTSLEDDLNITDKTTKTITISYSDSGVGMSTAVDAVTYQINTGDVENVTGTSATLEFNQGYNQTVTIKAKDKLGNVATLIKTGINVDTTAPTLEDIKPVPTYIKEGGTFTFGGNAKDNLSLKHLEIVATLNGTRVNQAGSDFWFSRTFTSSTSEALGIPDFSTVGKTEEEVNGTWKFILTAYDRIGNASVSQTVSFKVDISAPTVDTISAYPQTNIDSKSPFTFKGTASDKGVSEVQKVEYSLNGTNWETVDGNTTWYKDVDLDTELYTEGTGTFYARATDTAGNVSAVKTQEYVFDKAAPTMTVTDGLTQSSSKLFTLKGTASDSWKVNKVEITQIKGETELTVPVTITPNSFINWSTEASVLPLKAENTAYTATEIANHDADGVYTYKVTVTDAAGKTVDSTVTITFDTTAPTVTTSLEDNLNITDKTTKTITISYSDSGVGMSTATDAVTYQINTGTVTNVSGTSAELTFTQGNNQTVTIKAKDKLGNVATLIKTGINVDTEAPSLTDITIAPSYIKEGGTFTFGGNATDTLELNRIEIVATRDVTRVDQAGETTTDSWYSKTFTGIKNADSTTLAIPDFTTVGKSAAQANGTWKFVITAYDTAGNASVSQTVSFIVDVSAPTVSEISNYPKADVDNTSPFTFKGTASDIGSSGLNTIEYIINDSSASPAEGWKTAIGDKNWYTPDETIEHEGKHYIHVRATDTAGNVSEVRTQEFVFDTAKPTITVTGGLSRNVSDQFTLMGTASDSWQVNTVEITQTKGETTLSVPVQTITPSDYINWSTNTLQLPLKPDSSVYTDDEIANHDADGVYTYKVIATDAAGKESLISTVTITIDTTAPTTNTISSPVTGKTGINALSGTSYIFKGKVKDNTGGVGVEKLWYVFTKGSSTAPGGTAGYASIDVTDESSIDKDGNSWSITKTLATGVAEDGNITAGDLQEGKWYLHVKVADSAGNITEATSVEFDVDSSAPTLSVGTPAAGTTYLKQGDGLTLTGKTGDTAGNTTVSVYLDNISGTPIDTTTKLAVINTGDDSLESWTLAIPDTAFDQTSTKTYSVIVVAKDIFGKTTQATRTIYYDVKAPEVESTSISPVVNVSGTEKVNGTITVNYRISDEDMINSVKYGVYKGEDLQGSVTSLETPGSSNVNWNGSFTINTAALTDNTTYTIRFTTTDRCGNTGTKDLTINIDQSTDNPVLNFTNVNSNYSTFDSGMTNVLGSVVNNKILGSVTDDDGLTSLIMEISSDKINWETVGTNLITTTNTTSQSFSQAHLKTTEGEYFVRFTATDKNAKTTEKTFWIAVDNGAPVFSAVTPANGNFYSTTMAVSGKITDGSNSVTIEPSGNGTSTLEKTDIITTAPDGAVWTDTVTVPSDTGSSYAKTYTATDKYGQTSTYQVAYKVDKDAPTIALTSPDGLSTKYVKQQNIYQFTGTASDSGDSGLSTINYEIKNNTNDVITTGTANNTASWTVNIDFNEEYQVSDDVTEKLYPAGNYTITFYAEDKAGNSTIDVNKKTVNLVVDSDLPQITITEKPATYTKTSYTIKLTANENNIDTVKWDRKGTSVASGNMTLDTGISYKLDQTALTEGSYTYTFTLTDKAGNSVIETLSTTFDTEAPSISISTPAVNEITTSDTYTLSGTVSDLGSGVKEVKYALLTTVSIPADDSSDWKDTTVSGASWKAEGVDLGTTGSEGTFYLFVKATDNLDQRNSLPSRVFYKDLRKPEVKEIDVDTTGLITKEGFTLKGRAFDTNELSKIEISEGAKTWSTTNALDDATAGDTSNGFTTYIPKTTDPEAGNENWSKNFLVGAGSDDEKNYLADGVHTFTITVTDVAGKTSVIQRTVTVDTVAPTITNPKITTPIAINLGTEETPNNWYNKSIIDISANVTDETGSGVSLLEYSTDGGTSWSSLIKGSGSSWAGSVPVTTTSGEMTIYLRAKDAAGNQTGNTSIVLTANIDTEAPNTVTLGNVDGTTLAGVKLVNKGSDVVVEITAADATPSTSTGIKSVNLKKIGSTTATATGTFASGKWTVTINKNDLATGGAVFTVTDNAGNSADFTLFQVLVDDTAPSVSIGTPSDADTETAGVQVNGTISLSGTASDDQTLSAVKLYYSTATTAPAISPWDPPVNSGDPKWTQMDPVTGTYNWILSNINTTSAFGTLTDDAVVHLCATAQDSAGNLTASTVQDIIVNQDTDRPVIRFNNVSLTGMSKDSFVPLRNSGTVYGTVIDDDGTVKKLEYSVDGTNYTVIPVTNGSWNQSFNDGSQTIRFRVTDAKDKEFTSDYSNDDYEPKLTDCPKLTDGTNKYGTTAAKNTFFYLNVDTQNPSATDPTFDVYKTTTGAYTGTYSSDWATTKFGGTNSQLSVKLSASDSNAIASVVATFNGKDIPGVCSVAHNDASPHEWVIPDISLTGNGSKELVIIITDGAGLTTKLSKTLALDNTAPVITFIQPSSQISNAETIRGTVDSTSTVYYAVSTSGTTEPSNIDVANQSTAWTQESNASLSWNVYFDGAEVAGQTHTFMFRDYIWKLGKTTEEEVKTLRTYTKITDLYVWIKAVDESGNESTKFQEVKIDPQGNRPKLTLSYPETDNMTLGGTIRIYGTVTDDVAGKYVWVQIDANNSGKFDKYDLAYLNGDTLKDENGVEIKDGDTNITNEHAYDLGNITNNSLIDKASITTLLDDLITTDTPDPDKKTSKNFGIRVPVNGASWNLTLNSNKEFDPPDSGEDSAKTRTLTMWLYATDQDSAENINISNETTRTIVIDKDTPVIEQDSLKLVQYYKSVSSGTICTDGSVSSGTVAVTQAFVEGMSINGVWYLTGKITDSSGIKTIIKNSTNTYVISSDNTKYLKSNDLSITSDEFIPEGKEVTADDDTTKTIYNCNFHIKIGNASPDAVGSDKIEIEATENTVQELNVRKSFSVLYDNKAPVLVIAGENYNISSAITNSNGFYTFGASATESSVGIVNQTGVERIAFYFDSCVKGTNEDTYSIYDVMIKNGESGNNFETKTVKKEDVNGVITFKEPSYKDKIVESDGLYWKQVTVSSVSGAALTLSAADVNIHKGGLAKVNGIIYRIDDLSGTAVTLSGQPGTATTALIAIANVVDNTTAEGTGISKNDAGYYSDGLYDDGDMMIEKVVKQGTTAIWEASINSKNIPDGPVTLHYVVFDKAGNYSTGEIADAFVKNNQPRIAGIKIGNDDNGNGTVDATEFVTTWSGLYSGGYDEAGRKMTEVTIPNQTAGLKAAITAKGKIVIKPEIVGGNGDIGYTYSVAKNTDTTTWAEPYYEKTTVTPLGTGSTTDGVLTLTDIELSVKDFLSAGTTGTEIKDDVNQKFSFKIWDSTPGTTAGTDSQYATLNVIMNVALRDTEKPTAYINPFYWKSSTDNSLFENKRDNGHIELPEDLPSEIFNQPASYIYKTEDTENLSMKTKRPKVSGKIKIEGIAHDNKLLTEITVKITGFNSGNDLTIGKYEAGTWTPGKDFSTNGWASEITQATYAEMKRAGYITDDDVPKAGATPTEAELVAKVPEFSQSLGHTVHWTLYLDTSEVTGVAAFNQLIEVEAKDQGHPTVDDSGKPTFDGSGNPFYTSNNSVAVTGQTGETEGTGDTGETIWLTSQYTMDVVPYITKISTELSRIEKKNSSVYGRTPNGSYPVYYYTKDLNDSDKKETIKFEGFNLKSGATVTITSKSNTFKTGTLTTNNELTLPSDVESGDVKVTVNSIDSLNNINNDNAKGTYQDIESSSTKYQNYINYYNRQPNNTNNDLLTDNLSLIVWQINSKAALATSGKLSEVVMHVNPQNGQLGFAFASGADRASYPYGTDKDGNEQDDSYYQWSSDWTSVNTINFIYDSKGHMFGTQCGTDTFTPQSKAARFRLISSCWGVTCDNFTTMSDANTCYSAKNALRLEYMGVHTPSVILNKERFLYHPQLAASNPDDDTTNLYLMYYDSITNELKFRAGGIKNKVAFQGYSGVEEEVFDKAVSAWGDFADDANNNNTGYTTDYAHVSVIANAGTKAKPGKHYSVAVVPKGVTVEEDQNGTKVSKEKDVAVIVWGDEVNHTLWYSYMIDPITNNHVSVDATSHVCTSWSTPVAILDGVSGDHCAITVDSDKHIHIASYSKENTGSLIYTYLDTYDATDNIEKKSVVVDSYGTVGKYLKIEVAKDTNSNNIPYISYYSDSVGYPKYVYLKDTTSSGAINGKWTPKAGADAEDMYTGAWESIYLPTSSPVILDVMNLGLYRVDNVIANIPEITNTTTTTRGTVGGNGTSNPIIGYGIEYSGAGYVEIAQIK